MALRQRKKWKRLILARRAGLSESYVGHLERGHCRRPSANVVVALATALGVGVDVLLGLVPFPAA